MKKILIVVILVLLLGTVTVVFAAPAPKATGDVVKQKSSGTPWAMEFNAHEAKGNRPVKGHVSAHDYGEKWFSVDVTCVKVAGDTAYFGGPSSGWNEDQWRVFGVIDNGEPGNGDYVYRGSFDQEGDFNAWCANPALPDTEWMVIEGNLQVMH